VPFVQTGFSSAINIIKTVNKMHNRKPAPGNDWTQNVQLAFVEAIMYSNKTPNQNIIIHLYNKDQLKESLMKAGVDDREIQYASKQGAVYYAPETLKFSEKPTIYVNFEMVNWHKSHDYFTENPLDNMDCLSKDIVKEEINLCGDEEVCLKIFTVLDDYRKKGFSLVKAYALVNGHINRYFIKDEKSNSLVLEFDLKKSIPQIGVCPNGDFNGFGFTSLSFMIPATIISATNFGADFIDRWRLDKPSLEPAISDKLIASGVGIVLLLGSLFFLSQCFSIK